MAQPFDPVFTNWYTEKQIGSGTDGKVYTIIKENDDGTFERGILKTIRMSVNRDESRGFNNIGGIEKESGLKFYEDIINNITENIDIIKKADGGKRFVNYEEYEVRPTSDGKGRLILIRLEMMRSLADLLGEFSFTLNETIKLGISVCRSLIRCRSFGYIYPNLKPENILFDENGICKLGDFGSFSCLEPSRTSIAFKRTQYYMSPEFINSGKINCTADTYSLGLVLYTLVNRGRLPFTEAYPQEVTINGLDRSKMNRLNGVEFPKPVLGSDALFAIISKACAYKEEDRYLSPKQMLADLKNALENKPFEKAVYDDVYSAYTPEEKEKQQENKEDITPEPPEAEKAPEPQEPEIILKEEISIPDVTPLDYTTGKKPTAKKRRAPQARLPEYKPANNKAKKDTGKLIFLVIAVAVLLVLLFVSLFLRLGDENELQSVTALISQKIYFFYRGDIQWLPTWLM